MVFRLHTLALFCVLSFIVNTQAATCTAPSVRREWRQLATTERAEWIAAVKCLNKLPHDPALTPALDPTVSLIPPVNATSTFWDDISFMHMDLNSLIHFTGFFFPWHRAYVWGVENAMKEKCGYTGVQPYWNWTQDTADFYNSTMFDDDPTSGLGRWGNPDNDYQITTGAFATDFPVSYPSPHNIRRQYASTIVGGSGLVVLNVTIAQPNIDRVLTSFTGDFQWFQGNFEGIVGPHPAPHIMLGGDMSGTCPSAAPAGCVPGPKWTANDPMFFLHHAMVDKLWFDWQNEHPSNQYAFLGGSVSIFNGTSTGDSPTGLAPFLNFSSPIPSDGILWSNLTIWDVMNTTGDSLCYTYE